MNKFAKSLSIFLSIIFVLSGCTKDESKTVQEYTLDQLTGTWIISVADGELLAPRDYHIWEIDGSRAYYGNPDNGLWNRTSESISLEGNIITSVKDDGGAIFHNEILSLDPTTLITIDGGITYTATKLSPLEDYSESIQGKWFMEGEVTFPSGITAKDPSLLFHNSSLTVSYTDQQGEEKEMETDYLLYGIYMIISTEVSYITPFITYGYDRDKGRMSLEMHFVDKTTGEAYYYSFYRGDMKARLEGRWLMASRNGEAIPTNDLSIMSFRYSGEGLINYASDNKWQSVPFSYTTSEGSIIMDIQGEKGEMRIDSFTDTSFVATNPANEDVIECYRIPDVSPADDKIVGKWSSAHFVFFSSSDTVYATHNFSSDGVVTVGFSSDTEDHQGRYLRYGNLLVINPSTDARLWMTRFSEDGESLFMVNIEEDGSVTKNEMKKGLNPDMLCGKWNYGITYGERSNVYRFQLETLNEDGTGSFFCNYSGSNPFLEQHENWALQDSIVTFTFPDDTTASSLRLIDVTSRSITFRWGNDTDEELPSVMERITEDYSDDILGTWKTDIYDGCTNEYSDVTITFKEDGLLDFDGIDDDGAPVIWTDLQYLIFGDKLVLVLSEKYFPINFPMIIYLNISGNTMKFVWYIDGRGRESTFTR